MAMVHVTPPPLSQQALSDLLCTIIVLCQGMQANKRPFWAYICVKPSMAKAFKEARDCGNFRLEDYGTIIECGEGAHVPSDIRRRMETEYGVNHRFEDQLLAAIEEHNKNYAI